MTGEPRFGDMFGSFPTAQRLAFDIRSWGSVGGYDHVFGQRLAAVLNIPEDVIREVGSLPADDYEAAAVRKLSPFAMSAQEIVSHLASEGATFTVLHNPPPTTPGISNDSLADLVAEFPEQLIGFGRLRLEDPLAAVNELKRFPELGLKGVTITPFWHRVRANAPELRPIFSTCSQLGLPIWIHTSMYWDRSIPLSYEHPSYLDELAAEYPDLTIIAGHGGWPWIPDMVAVAWRHPNVYVDVSAFRPKHVATPSTGWDLLWHHIPRMLRKKVVMGSTWQLLGSPLSTVLAEARSLGLDEAVQDDWLYGNLARLLGVGESS